MHRLVCWDCRWCLPCTHVLYRDVSRRIGMSVIGSSISGRRLIIRCILVVVLLCFIALIIWKSFSAAGQMCSKPCPASANNRVVILCYPCWLVHRMFHKVLPIISVCFAGMPWNSQGLSGFSNKEYKITVCYCLHPTMFRWNVQWKSSFVHA